MLLRNVLHQGHPGGGEMITQSTALEHTFGIANICLNPHSQVYNFVTLFRDRVNSHMKIEVETASRENVSPCFVGF